MNQLEVNDHPLGCTMNRLSCPTFLCFCKDFLLLVQLIELAQLIGIISKARSYKKNQHLPTSHFEAGSYLYSRVTSVSILRMCYVP